MDDNKRINKNLMHNINCIDSVLKIKESYDLIGREITVAGKNAKLYIIDGFVDNGILEKLLEAFGKNKAEDMPYTVEEFIKNNIPVSQVSLEADIDKVNIQILIGMTCVLIDGYDKAIILDIRDYPARSVEEPEKDKVLIGSRDGFVETIVANTALIRRRIRSPQLVMKMKQAGDNTHTNIVLAYMENRVNKKFLKELEERIDNLKVDAITMNQQSLAECIFPYKWYNPFPKFKYSERPDTAAACILEGNIVILVDNSPAVMIIPVSVFDIIEEANDYYFPPITGTYLKLTKLLVNFVTLTLTPLWVLLTLNPQWVPQWLEFAMIKDEVNIPVALQFLILELAIDGMKMAAINTPNMLNTPLSIVAGLVLGDFSVSSGWFNSEVMLYMAFVAVANYSQVSFELGYALKFMRIITLVLTALFNIYGFVAGWIITILAIIKNKTISGESYIYPIIPFNFKKLMKRLIRERIKHETVKNNHNKSEK